MNIGILGLGSLGSLMAYHWRNHALFVLPRTDISSVNIKVQDQDTLWQTQLPSWQGEPLEWLVVCTKAADTLAALNKWKHLLTQDRKSTRLNSSHVRISYAVFCLKKK